MYFRRFGWTLVCALIVTGTPALGQVPGEGQPPAYYVLVDTSGSMNEMPQPPKVPKAWSKTILAEVKEQLGNFCSSLPTGTEVAVFSFDEKFVEGPHVVIAGDKQRDRLRQYFSGLNATGGSTHLWRSTGQVLERAAEATRREPGKTVQVLLFTDGEDNDSSHPDPDQVLAPYDALLKERIRPSLVTLGFKLRADLLPALQRHHVDVHPTVDPEMLIPLSPSISWHPSQPVVGEEVQLVDHSGGFITEWRWTFGDGSSSQAKAPTHRYDKAGSYDVQLTIRGPAGKTKSVKQTAIIVPPETLQAGFQKPPQEVPAGAPIQFFNNSRGSVHGFAWDFGDGTVDTTAQPTHAFAGPGIYPVRLTVTGKDGRTNVYTEEVRVVGPKPPVVDFFCVSSAQAGESVQFFDRSQGLVDARRWSFGDGSSAATERDPRHTFVKPGTCQVELTASGPGGKQSRVRELRILPPQSPVAAFVIGATDPRAKDVIVFTDISKGQVASAVWDFGGGKDTMEVNYDATSKDDARSVKHWYDEPGKYTVTLRVRGPGGEHQQEQSLSVRKPEGGTENGNEPDEPPPSEPGAFSWAWLCAAAVGVLIAAGLLWYGNRRRAENAVLGQLARLDGVMHCRPTNLPGTGWHSFEVPGGPPRFTFRPSDSLPAVVATELPLEAVLRVSVDRHSRRKSYSLELHEHRRLRQTLPIEPGVEVTEGDFVYRYLPHTRPLEPPGDVK
ncbi:MAG: PKD domain-containing protein [Planctomycetota bacterium]|nr:PKD domain-containing protein [Planctomycetota bacterium]